MRILLVGDSTACSLTPGMQAVGKVAGADVQVGAVSGCGFAAAEITSVRNEPAGPNTDRCREYVRVAQDTAVAQLDPDIVVWTSLWEKSDVVIGGWTLRSGTPEGDAAMLDLMDQAYRRVTAGGARVVLLTTAPPAPNPGVVSADGTPLVDIGYERLTSIQRRFTARHPGEVTVIDMARHICEGGAPCPAKVGGVRMRPDGRHFSPASSANLARWLFPQILSLLR